MVALSEIEYLFIDNSVTSGTKSTKYPVADRSNVNASSNVRVNLSSFLKIISTE